MQYLPRNKSILGGKLHVSWSLPFLCCCKKSIEKVGDRMKNVVIIDGEYLSIEDAIVVANNKVSVELSQEGRQKVLRSYQTVQQLIKENRTMYGINTGFGQLCNTSISEKEAIFLQKNLIMSHSCGVGEIFPEEIVRMIMLLSINKLAKGYSGVNINIIDTLISMLNKGVHPVIPEKGSLGASGDLVPLAHMVLVMIGEGEALYQGKRISGEEAMRLAEIPIVELKGKDGLGLINGTQTMAALGVMWVYEAKRLIRAANVSTAMTFEALNGLTNALDKRIHAVRPHPGQMECAAHISDLLKGSTYINGEDKVQDAYSLRCVPQVHGATIDAVNHVEKVLEIEINSVTDNPLVFSDDMEVISGGNFHGQPLAINMDYLAIALSELANISERRIERMVNPQLSGLPAFLSPNSGLNSGYMIAQYTAASLVSENKVMSTPASVDSIPSSANQEDHVSMGANAARKVKVIIDNLRNVLAIELLCTVQAIDLQEKAKLGQGTEEIYRIIRSEVPYLDKDRVMYKDIDAVAKMLKEGRLNI